MSLLELFCDVDDFVLSFLPQWKATQVKACNQRERAGQLCPSEVMTILIHFDQSHYRTFKAYYIEHVQVHLRSEFPRLVSYQRFVALVPGVMVPMLVYAARAATDRVQASASLTRRRCRVCKPKRINGHRVFAVDAKRGKTSMGWFFGFQLHLAVNDQGELLACCLTPGNVDDRIPVPQMVPPTSREALCRPWVHFRSLKQAARRNRDAHLITRLRKNMRKPADASFGQTALVQTRDYPRPSLTSSRISHRSSILAIAVLPILWCICLLDSLPTVIRTKNRVCISTNTLFWLHERSSLNRTHVW